MTLIFYKPHHAEAATVGRSSLCSVPRLAFQVSGPYDHKSGLSIMLRIYSAKGLSHTVLFLILWFLILRANHS